MHNGLSVMQPVMQPVMQQWFVRPWRHLIFFDGRVDGGVVSVGNMAGVLFEDIFNVKDIDPEGKKFDRGESTSELTIRCVGATTCRGAARPIFIARTIASRALEVDLADSAGTAPRRARAHGVTAERLSSDESS